MKIIVDVHIIYNNHLHCMVGKEYNSDLIPVQGMLLEDTVWKDPREINKVTISPTDNYYYIYIGEDVRDSKEECEALKAIYLSHNWTRFEGR